MTDGLGQLVGESHREESEKGESVPASKKNVTDTAECATATGKQSTELAPQPSEAYLLRNDPEEPGGTPIIKFVEGQAAAAAAVRHVGDTRSNGHDGVQKLPQLSQPAQQAEAQQHQNAYSARPPKKCVECGSMDTPMWRTHPVHGRGTLCNACGVKLYRQQCKERVQKERSAAGTKADEGYLAGWGLSNKRQKMAHGNLQTGWDQLKQQEGALCVQGCQFAYKGQSPDGSVEPRAIHDVAVMLKLLGSNPSGVASSHLVVLSSRGDLLATHHTAEVDPRMEYDHYLNASVWDSREGWWLLLPTAIHVKSFQALMRCLAACKLGFSHPPPLPQGPPTPLPAWSPPRGHATSGAKARHVDGGKLSTEVQQADGPVQAARLRKDGVPAQLLAAMSEPPLGSMHEAAKQMAQRLQRHVPPHNGGIHQPSNHASHFQSRQQPETRPADLTEQQPQQPGWPTQRPAAQQAERGGGEAESSVNSLLAALAKPGEGRGGVWRLLSERLRATSQPAPEPQQNTLQPQHSPEQGPQQQGSVAAKLPSLLLSQLELLSKSAARSEPFSGQPAPSVELQEAGNQMGLQPPPTVVGSSEDRHFPGFYRRSSGHIKASQSSQSLLRTHHPSQSLSELHSEGGRSQDRRWSEPFSGAPHVDAVLAGKQQALQSGGGSGGGQGSEQQAAARGDSGWGAAAYHSGLMGVGVPAGGLVLAQIPQRPLAGRADVVADGASQQAHGHGRAPDASQAQGQADTDAALRLLAALQQQQQQQQEQGKEEQEPGKG